MSGKTLDYDSCAKWMSLSVWAAEEYARWKFDPLLVYTDETYIAFFHKVAEEALERAFSLRAGYRVYAVLDLLKAVAPGNVALHSAFSRIDHDTWLTMPGERRR